jgi:hypothetical protein
MTGSSETTTMMMTAMTTTVGKQFLIPTFQGISLVRSLLATADIWAEGL